MKSNWFIAVPFAAAMLVAACSNSSSPGTGTGSNGLACSTTVAGATSCVIYKNLSSAQQTAVTDECTGSSSIVSSCPTSSLIGCCTQTVGGIDEEECYYNDTTGGSSEAGAGTGVDAGSAASAYQTDCTQTSGNTWSTTQ